MKKHLKRFIASLLLVAAFSQTAYAQTGDMSFFGGVSEGTRLPKTTETLLKATGAGRNTQQTPIPYKETIFINGEPVVCEALLTVKTGAIPEGTVIGSFTETHTIAPSATTDPDASLRRTITFNVNYRVEGKQTILDYEMTNWTETITAGGQTYTLDKAQSKFGASVIKDAAPGVTYYKGDMSQRAVYTTGGAGGAGGAATTVETNGSFYGYTSAWSSTEVHRIDGTVSNDDWQMQYQVRPSVSVAKSLQYSKNEPTAISFAGNYREVMQNQSGLTYDIFVKPNQFYEVPNAGMANIASYNAFEQLPFADVNYLKGHPAASDIEKLFSMQVLTGDTKFYKPEQAITRGQFVTAVTKAIKLPIENITPAANARTKPTIEVVFPDVLANREEYPYVMSAYKAGLAVGRSNGYFAIDAPIERQEAIAILLRTLGLQNLALDPTPMTVFTDDEQIAGWAKNELMAAYAIGLISPDSDGKINPKAVVSKAEAAALVNRLIEYMRTDIAADYSEHIVNYSN